MVAGVLALVDLDCEQRAVGNAVVEYLQGATGPVVDELANPDGKFDIPEVAIPACP